MATFYVILTDDNTYPNGVAQHFVKMSDAKRSVAKMGRPFVVIKATPNSETVVFAKA